MSVDKILEERGARYGPFSTHAQITQDLKSVMHAVPGWRDLPKDVKESLEMIQHKIARILNGQHSYRDSWDDIAGYATLISKEIDAQKTNPTPSTHPYACYEPGPDGQ